MANNSLTQAKYWEKRSDGKILCILCPRGCIIGEGKEGYCRHRVNKEGVLYAYFYGRISASHMDPIEKKPLYHFFPGTWIYSIGTGGCNLGCRFCQNWELVKGPVPMDIVLPEELARISKANGSIGIAYTYNEPTVWFEYVSDCSKEAKIQGLKNVLVTNGYLNAEPWDKLLDLVDAANIDLKSIRPEFYRKMSDGLVEPVKRNIAASVGRIHVEVTNLLIPGANDSTQEIEELVNFIASCSPDIPLHFSRYFPNYKYESPPTPLESLENAYEIARRKLKYVYLGNVRSATGQDTLCHSCRNPLVKRSGYQTRIVGLQPNSTCGNCGTRANFKLPGL